MKCISLWGQNISVGFGEVEWGCILLVHWYNWYDWYQWNNIYSIGEMHFIIGTYNISIGFRPSGGAFYFSIGRIGTISTTGKTFIPLVKCISFQGLRIFSLASGGVHSTRPLARLVPME